MALGVIILGYNITRWHNLWVGEIKLVDRFLTSHYSLKKLQQKFLPILYVKQISHKISPEGSKFSLNGSSKISLKGVRRRRGTVAQKFR